jgi:hypothetical protein
MCLNGRKFTIGFKVSGKKSIGTIPPEKKVNRAYLKSMNGKISTNQKASSPMEKLSMEISKYPKKADKRNAKNLKGSNGIWISKIKVEIIIMGTVLAKIWKSEFPIFSARFIRKKDVGLMSSIATEPS